PGVLRGFRCRHPHIRIKVLASDKNENLQKARCDLAVRARFQLSRQTPPENQFLRLPLTLVCAPDLPLDLSMPAEERIEALPYLGYTFRVTNRVLLAESPDAKRPIRLNVNADVEINNASFGSEMALQGHGMALVIRQCVEHHIDAGRLVEVAPELDFGCVHLQLLQRDPYPSDAAAAVKDYLLHALPLQQT
ncbi:MAG: LysR substrate-binding domain-containing protein, partial [Pseudomonadota bacterium]